MNVSRVWNIFSAVLLMLGGSGPFAPRAEQRRAAAGPLSRSAGSCVEPWHLTAMQLGVPSHGLQLGRETPSSRQGLRTQGVVPGLPERESPDRTHRYAAAAPVPTRTPAPGRTPAVEEQQVGIAAYFYPAGGNLAYWEQLRSAPRQVAFAVATGLGLEGEKPDTNYQEQIRKTRAAGVRMLAYVTTSGSSRPLEALKREIDHAYAWYGVDGIFFDESVPYPVTCNQVPYHTELNRYVKAKGGPALTVINHGQILPECYATTADILMNAEMSYESYLKEWRPSGWEHRYPAKKFWHLIHGVDTEEKMRRVLALSKARNARYVFMTPVAATPNVSPYASLPPRSYWTRLLEALHAPAER